MYKIKFKQILASVLSAAMILTAAPVGVLAEEIAVEDTYEIINDAEEVSEIIDENYDITEEIEASGNEGDLRWTVDKNYNLSITGTFSGKWGDWKKYQIKTATIDVKGATSFESLFSGQNSITSADFTGTDFSSVTSMRQMFNSCFKLEKIKFGNVDTSNVVDMSRMFRECSALTELDLSSFNTSNVIDMGNMFENCVSLTKLNVSGFDTSKVDNFQKMFYGCKSVETLDVSNFETSSATTFQGMFSDCKKLKSLDLKKFNTSKIDKAGFSGMFANCESLEALDISSFKNNSCGNMGEMFKNCKALKSIDMSNFDLGRIYYKIGGAIGVFDGCISLVKIKTPLNVGGSIDLPADSKGNKSFYVEGNESDEWTTLPQGKTTSVTLIRKGTNPSKTDPTPTPTPEEPSGPVAENEINPVIFKEITVPFKEINLGLTKANSKKGIIGNNTITVIPSISSNNVMNKLVWSVDNKTVASVSKGKITAKKPGKAIVTVKLKRGNEVLDSATIDVNVKDDSRIVLPNTFIDGNGTDSYDINIKAKGVRGLLNAKVDPNKGILLTVLGATTAKANKVKWSSSDKSVAVVASNGKVIGKTPGTATITATLDGKKVNYIVEVCAASIIASSKSFEMSPGSTLDLASKILAVSGVNKNKEDILWMPASNKQSEKISLSKDGVVTARSTGKVNVLAMINGVMVKFTIKIKTGGVPTPNPTPNPGKTEYIVKEQIGDFSWSIDSNGKLVMEGTVPVDKAEFPVDAWCGYRDYSLGYYDKIKSAEIKIKGCKNLGALFSMCPNLKTVDFSGTDFSTVDNIAGMFLSCNKLTSVNFGNADISNITDMTSLFSGCSELEQINGFSKINTSNITSMNSVFMGCKKLKNIDLSGFDTSSCVSFYEMFYGCESLEYLDLDSFSTKKASLFKQMFEGCTSLKEIKFGQNFSFNSLGDDLDGCVNMFARCESLETIDMSWIKEIDGNYSYYIHGMFAGCTKLKTIDLSGWDMSKALSDNYSKSAFDGCINLKTIKTPINVGSDCKISLAGEYLTPSGDVVTSIPTLKSESISLTKK